MLREVLMKIGGFSHQGPDDPTAEKLHKLLPSCAVCGTDSHGHRYVQLATAFSEITVAEMLRLVRSHRWAELLTLEEWNPETNGLVAYAVAGPHEGGMVIAIKSSHDLYESDEVYLNEKLLPDDMADLLASLNGKAWSVL